MKIRLALILLLFAVCVDAVTGINALAQSNQLSLLSIDTKDDAKWSSVPFEFLDGKKGDLLSAERGDKRLDWNRPPITLAELCDGVHLSTNHVQSGTNSLEWRDHQKYPTIATQSVPSDWSHYHGLMISCYSEHPTGETITVGVLADNPRTPYQDFWAKDLIVDWTGWKQLSFPFSSFEKKGSPRSWRDIKGLYFFTKAKRNSPNPQTALFLDQITLTSASDKRETNVASAAEVIQNELLFNPLTARSYDAPVVLNHSEPELLVTNDPAKPITEQYFYQGVRALYGYNPRFNPGFVSVDPKGNAYIRSLTEIDWLGGDGSWKQKSLLPPIREFCQLNHWKAFTISWNDSDLTTRFDQEGEVYLLVQLHRLDREGKDVGFKERSALLLYAQGIDQPWSWVKLPGRTADFEKIEGFNQDALDHPPVITLSDYTYNKDADQQGYLLLPKKTANGLLQIPQPIPVGVGKAEQVLLGPVHEGRGSFVVSHGEKVFFVYGSAPQATDPKNFWAKPRDPEWLASLHIPADHPANKLISDSIRGEVCPSSAGLPTFVRSYDRKTRRMSDPVFIGYGGRFLDVHNWSAMVRDSKGILHVIISGHCEAPLYTHTLKPDDITAWTPPVFIHKSPNSPDYCHASYPSLTCDKNDNLLYVFRSDTDIYDHRLACISKDAGKEMWNVERSILVPVVDGYHAWEHSLSYDPMSNRHFLTLLEGWRPIDTADHNYFARFIFPFAQFSPWDVKHNPNILKLTPTTPEAIPESTDAVVLVSDDVGKSWRIATTPDFIKR